MHRYTSRARRGLLLFGLITALVLCTSPLRAGLLDTLKNTVLSGSGSTTATGALTDSEVIDGLKEALRTTVSSSLNMLSTSGGFLNTPSVHIPVPDSLKTAEQLARSLGQDKLADQFITSMNSAAEQAAGETASIFMDAIGKMSFADARSILNGPSDAATGYFKRTSTDALTTRIRPIVEKATSAAKVTESYKNFTAKLKLLSPLMNTGTTDLDGYVTGKTVDGIFTIMAQEEAEIRSNPAARTTDLLKRVFGSTGQ